MNVNYDFDKAVSLQLWAESRETHIGVANAIFAIADSNRAAESIWEDPTTTECQHIKMALEQYIEAGLIEPSDDGRYCWGVGFIRGPAPTKRRCRRARLP
jgi:hypothetical protein